MDKNVILIIAGYILYLIVALGNPWQIKKIQKNAGECHYSFGHFDKAKTILIYILSLVLIALVSLRFFSFFAKVVLEFCAIAGVYISSKESSFAKMSGIYTNGVICSEGYFPYDDILTLPILNLSKEEQENYPKNELIFATNSKGNVQIILNDEKTAENIKSKLFDVCPRLIPNN